MRINSKLIFHFFVALLSLTILIFPFHISSDYYYRPTLKPLETKPEEPIEESIDINALRSYYNNDDILAYVKIDNISLESVVVQSFDNNYYLNHDINNNRSVYGVPFIDYRNKKDLPLEKQINIYGHNSSIDEFWDGLPFSNLRHITDETIFNNLSDIKLYTDGGLLTYEPYIVKVITTDYEYTRLRFVDDDILQNHLNNLTSNTMYCKGSCEIPRDKNILILQTCYYNPKGSYLLLIGIR